MRVGIFIDGKNFYTGWRDCANGAQIDFSLLSDWLVSQVGATDLIGCHYYTGVESEQNALDETRGKLHNFLRILEAQRGYFVHTFERRPHTTRCTSCNENVPYTQEKEVDTTVVADMVFWACQDAFDAVILLSGDADYVPAVRILNRLAKKVYVASWAGTGVSQSLRNLAFDHINLVNGLPKFRRADARHDLDIPELDSASPKGSGPDAFLHELSNAEKQFDGGYVGLGYFLSKWKSPVLTDLPDQRREILDKLLQEGLVEVYTAHDGKEAIRLVEEEDDASY